jgi:phenylpropionate dioxygenase-like ring-hydroxylating dioxygenase large terminal subunit
VGIELGGLKYVAFRDHEGRAVALAGRCAHMGADLAKGRVVGGVLCCPLHGWEYGGDGRCVRIPATDRIPPFACQTVYPTVEMGGHVVLYNGPVAPFAMPFYDGRSVEEFEPAEPFDVVIDSAWYMIGANGFDVQHFRVAHDRALIGEPVVDAPAAFARRMVASYDVAGGNLRDRFTRRVAGPRVRMTVTSWAGTLILVTAEFRRTTTYGMVFVQPLSEHRTRVRTILWLPRRRGIVGRAVLGPIDRRVRRGFIRAFLADDAARSQGARYNPATLIDADREMAAYLDWLAALSA